MEFNMLMVNEGEMERTGGSDAVDALMTDDVLVNWLMNLEQEDAAIELMDERRMRAVRHEDRVAASA